MMLRRNWKNILAWGSVCLNLLLIGVIIIGPHKILPFPPGPPGPPSPQKMLGHMGKDLTGQDRVAFQKLLEKHSGALDAHHMDMDAAFGQIRQAVKSEPFEIKNVETAHQGLVDKRVQINNSIHKFMMDVLRELTPEGRQKLRLGPPGPPPK